MKKLLLILLCIKLFLVQEAIADSPLTSTDISSAYKDHPIVLKASKSDGVISPELIDYLISQENPIDVKIAIINKLSWDINGKKNSLLFWQYIKEIFDYKNEKDFQKKGHGDHLLCMAYLRALDNYHNVDTTANPNGGTAIFYADLAFNHNRYSYTYNIIKALITAQYFMDFDWCHVFILTHSVRVDDKLNKDMRINAISNIFQYMDGYKKYCKD